MIVPQYGCHAEVREASRQAKAWLGWAPILRPAPDDQAEVLDNDRSTIDASRSLRPFSFTVVMLSCKRSISPSREPVEPGTEPSRLSG